MRSHMAALGLTAGMRLQMRATTRMHMAVQEQVQPTATEGVPKRKQRTGTRIRQKQPMETEVVQQVPAGQLQPRVPAARRSTRRREPPAGMRRKHNRFDARGDERVVPCDDLRSG